MQITIQGTERRVRFTKREIACMQLAANLMTELATTDDDAEPAGLHLCNVLGRIDFNGLYNEPEETPDAAD